jgi:hypothetical protein
LNVFIEVGVAERSASELHKPTKNLKGNLGLSYLRDRHAARVNMRFVGEYEDNASINNRIGDVDIDSYYAFDVNYTYTYTVPVKESFVPQ